MKNSRVSVVSRTRPVSPYRSEWAHVADAVPGVELVRRLALRLVALEEVRHEEFARERGQPDPASLAVQIGMGARCGRRPRGRARKTARAPPRRARGSAA